MKSLLGRTGFPELFLFLILATAMVWPAPLQMTGAVIGDHGDSLLCSWILAWNGHKILSGDPGGLFHANIFYPHRYTLAYSENLLGVTVLVLPVIHFWRNPLLSYNVAFMISLFLSAAGAYFLARRLTGCRPAAFCAGLIFAFFPWRFGHLSALQLQAAGWIPLAFLFLHRLVDGGGWKDGVMLGLCFALQFLSCGYYGIYLAFFGGLFVLLALARNLRRGVSSLYFARGLLVSALLGAALIAPAAQAYLRVRSEKGFERPVGEAIYYSADVVSYLRINGRLKFWSNFLPVDRDPGGRYLHESNLFPGLIAVLLAAAGVILEAGNHRKRESGRLPLESRPRLGRGLVIAVTAGAVLSGAVLVWIAAGGGLNTTVAGVRLRATTLSRPLWITALLLLVRSWLTGGFRRLASIPAPVDGRAFASRFYSLMIVLAFLFTLGPLIRVNGRPLGAGPYQWLYDHFPGFQGLRVPARAVIMVALGLSLMSARSIAAGWKKISSPGVKFILLAAVSAALLGESRARISLAPMPTGDDIPEVYRWLAEEEDDFAILELPLPRSPRTVHTETRYMYFSTYHWKNLVNGYGGYFPDAYNRLYQSVIHEFPSEESIAYIRELGPRYLIIHHRWPEEIPLDPRHQLLKEEFSHLLERERIFDRSVVYRFP